MAKLRKQHDFPLKMEYENSWGLYDLGYEPFYQLLRMTLLAKTTTPLKLTEDIEIEDYRILHLSHSQNSKLNTVTGKHLKYCPGIKHLKVNPFHEIWSNFILAENESSKFKFGFWDEHLNRVTDKKFYTYLNERYG